MEETIVSVLSKKILTKTSPLFYAGGVQWNAYFYSCWHCRECGQIGCTKAIGEFGPQWYRIGSSTGVDFEIWIGQQNNCISVEITFDWLANKNLPWSVYHEFMSGRLIALEKNPGIRPVGIRETWRWIFDKCVLRVTGPESTNTCKYEHICYGLKAWIDGAIHGVQDMWDDNPSMGNWGFLLVDQKISSTK